MNQMLEILKIILLQEALTRAQAFQITNHKITNHQYTRFTFTKPFFTQTIIFTNPKNHNLFILQFHLSTICLFHKLFLLQTVHIYSKISRSPDVLKQKANQSNHKLCLSQFLQFLVFHFTNHVISQTNEITNLLQLQILEHHKQRK